MLLSNGGFGISSDLARRKLVQAAAFQSSGLSENFTTGSEAHRTGEVFG